MSTLYLITGPAGAGKSTVSKKIAGSVLRSALIEGDDIYNQVVGGYALPWEPGNHLELFRKVCIQMIRTYLEAGYDVVFDYIITPELLSLFRTEFRDQLIRFAVLLVSEEVLLERDRQRAPECRMGDRCIELLDSFRNAGFDAKNVLDTSLMTVEEISDIVIKDKRFIEE